MSRLTIDFIDIEQKTEAVATGKGFFKEMPALMPNLRVALSGKHYIFCFPQQNAPAPNKIDIRNVTSYNLLNNKDLQS